MKPQTIVSLPVVGINTETQYTNILTDVGKIKFSSVFKSGPGCSKLTTSLGNVSLKIQTLISQIRQYFLLKKCEISHFVQQKISVYLFIKS